MTASVGAVTVTLSLAVGAAPAQEVGSVEVPVAARVEGSAPGELRAVLEVAPDAFGAAIAGALRGIADRFDPAMPDPEPVDLAGDLAPGAVLLRCAEPGCGATMAGWPGETIEHADGGAHVWSSTYGAGA
ncbi:hypothetical protein ACEYYH_10545 [Microbacterium trichothecenolyticum]|uniref:hypothetical protein n=1 Tax=Microbacterium trichothecenolyticum TaxID=69370 RepID=UPI0035BE8F5A